MSCKRTGRGLSRLRALFAGLVSSIAMALPVGLPLMVPRKFVWVNIAGIHIEAATVLFCPGSRQSLSEIKEMLLGNG